MRDQPRPDERRATALRFDQAKGVAPEILLQARDDFAARIVSEAERAGVKVVCDPELSRVISMLPAGREIPESLYIAVSKIFALLYREREHKSG